MKKELNDKILDAIKLVAEESDGMHMSYSVSNESGRPNPFKKDKQLVVHINIQLTKMLAG
jgi:hypothetical protein